MNATILSTTSTQRLYTALTVLRVIVGIVFLAHGAQKLFGFGLAGVTGAFTQMGIPLPGVTAPLVTLVELFGGIALIVGLLTRLAALGLAIEMLGAILLVHLKGGFFLPNGFEYAFTLLGASVVLALAGPGAYAVDNVIAARRTGAVRVV
jgi:putative oxidoreductase